MGGRERRHPHRPLPGDGHRPQPDEGPRGLALHGPHHPRPEALRILLHRQLQGRGRLYAFEHQPLVFLARRPRPYRRRHQRQLLGGHDLLHLQGCDGQIQYRRGMAPHKPAVRPVREFCADAPAACFQKGQPSRQQKPHGLAGRHNARRGRQDGSAHRDDRRLPGYPGPGPGRGLEPHQIDNGASLNPPVPRRKPGISQPERLPVQHQPPPQQVLRGHQGRHHGPRHHQLLRSSVRGIRAACSLG